MQMILVLCCGPKIFTEDLLWAIWTPRERKNNKDLLSGSFNESRTKGVAPQMSAAFVPFGGKLKRLGLEELTSLLSLWPYVSNNANNAYSGGRESMNTTYFKHLPGDVGSERISSFLQRPHIALGHEPAVSF